MIRGGFLLKFKFVYHILNYYKLLYDGTIVKIDVKLFNFKPNQIIACEGTTDL